MRTVNIVLGEVVRVVIVVIVVIAVMRLEVA